MEAFDWWVVLDTNPGNREVGPGNRGPEIDNLLGVELDSWEGVEPVTVRT